MLQRPSMQSITRLGVLSSEGLLPSAALPASAWRTTTPTSRCHDSHLRFPSTGGCRSPCIGSGRPLKRIANTGRIAGSCPASCAVAPPFPPLPASAKRSAWRTCAGQRSAGNRHPRSPPDRGIRLKWEARSRPAPRAGPASGGGNRVSPDPECHGRDARTAWSRSLSGIAVHGGQAHA